VKDAVGGTGDMQRTRVTCV